MVDLRMRNIVAIELKLLKLLSDFIGRSMAISIIEHGKGFVDRIKVRSSLLRWLLGNIKLVARLL